MVSQLPIRSVVVLHRSPDDFRARLEAGFPAVKFTWVDRLDRVEEALAAARPDAVFSIAQAGFRSDTHGIAASYETVRWVHCGGSGYDHLLPLDRGRTVLTNCAGVLAPYLAETVIGAIYALNGNFPEYLAQQRQRHWRSIPFRSLSEQSLMVIGLGAIGSAVAQKASAAGMRVLGVSRSKRPSQSIDEQFLLAELKNVIGMADVITVHVPLNGETRHLIDRQMIEAMKPGAIFINTARGDLVDEDALFDALKSRHIRAAYLDVFRQEPLPATSQFWDLDNIIITPHCADAIVGWARKYSDVFATNLARWDSGEPMLNLVARPASGARSRPQGVSDV